MSGTSSSPLPAGSTVAVTGGAGFIGSAVRRRATLRGLLPVALVRECELELLEDGAERRVVDWESPDGLTACLRGLSPVSVVHCAGASVRGAGSVASIYEANIGLTARLLEAVCAACPAASVVLLSSAAVYGSGGDIPTPECAPLGPESHYAASKVMTEMVGRTFFLQSGLRVTAARPFNVIGSGEPAGSVVSDLAAQVLPVPRGGTAAVSLRETVSVRDFVDVDDVADALLVLAERGDPGEAYNVCSGSGVSIGELAAEAGRVWGRAVAVTVTEPEDRGTVSVGDAARLRALGWAPARSLADSLAGVAGGVGASQTS